MAKTAGAIDHRWFEVQGRNGTWFVDQYRSHVSTPQTRATYGESVQCDTRKQANLVSDALNAAYRAGRVDQDDPPPMEWHYVSDDEIRIGQYVSMPPYADAQDIGTVESFDGEGWLVRTLTGELTGPWPVTELVNQYRALPCGTLGENAR